MSDMETHGRTNDKLMSGVTKQKFIDCPAALLLDRVEEKELKTSGNGFYKKMTKQKIKIKATKDQNHSI